MKMKDKQYYETQATYDEWLAWFKETEHERYTHPDVTVDLVIVRFEPVEKQLQVLTEKRSIYPFKDQWSLLGTYFKEHDKDVEDTANQAWLSKVTESIPMPKSVSDINVFSTLGRDPRGQVVSIAKLVFVGQDLTIGSHQKWTNIQSIVNDEVKMAFDHTEIVVQALTKMRILMNNNRMPLALLGKNFALNEAIVLQSVLFGRGISSYNRANVRKFILPYVLEYRNKAKRMTRYTYDLRF